MEFVYNVGEALLAMTTPLSDWLMSPVSPKIAQAFENPIIDIGFFEWLNDAIYTVASANVYEVIIGGGIIGLLGFKVVKFFVDIVL